MVKLIRGGAGRHASLPAGEEPVDTAVRDAIERAVARVQATTVELDDVSMSASGATGAIA